MKDQDKTKDQLTNELVEMRQRVAELKAAGTERKRVEARLEHLTLVLRAIRSVNQLITRERDRDKLLQGACDHLIETRGYYNAWIALIDGSRRLVTTAEAGLGEAFLPLVEQLERGELTDCGRAALSQPGVVVTEDPPSACTDCPLSAKYRGRGAMTVRLEYGGRVYGLLTVSIPRDLVADEEEQALFEEVAGDIAFALHSIELEEERKRVEEALRQAHEQLNATLNALPDLLFEVDRHGRIYDFRAPHPELLYTSPQEFLGQTVNQVLPEEAASVSMAALGQAVETGRHAGAIYTLETPAGPGWFELSIAAKGDSRAPDGRLIALVRDITERVRAEERLRLLSSAAEQSTEGIAASDLEGNLLFVNNAFAAMHGYTPQELVGKHLSIFHTPEQMPSVEAANRQIQETGEFSGEIWHVRRDGTVFPSLMQNSLLWDETGNPIGMIGTLRDITERKRAEEATKLAYAELDQIFQTAADGMRVIDKDFNVLRVNETFSTLAGVSRDEVVSKKCYEVFPGPHCHTPNCPLTRILSGEERVEYEVEKERNDGIKIPCILMATPFRGLGGELIGVVEDFKDITVRKRAEEEIKRLKEFNEGIIQSMAEGIAVEDAEGYFTFVNPAAATLLGYAPEELLGQHWTTVIPPDQQPIVQAADERRMRGEAHRYELQLIRKDETRVPVLVSGSPRFEEGRFAGTLAVFTDITERKRAEEELQRTTENLRKALGATIQAIALTVETKDPYTAGHQRRVADLARALAIEVGLPREQTEGLRLAGVIHDIGKISVPGEILSKPGRLSAIEFSLIKTHPQAAYDILKTIEFPWPVAQIVLQHHERMDGSGYPQGLSSGGILLEARILAVADVVEAMSSYRPYRPAHGIDKALEEILQNRGVLYDPEVVEACLKLFTEKGFTFE